jgi:hypothetical protein
MWKLNKLVDRRSKIGEEAIGSGNVQVLFGLVRPHETLEKINPAATQNTSEQWR